MIVCITEKPSVAKDIAQMAAFLADETGDYITGQVISVDGGMNM